jgi:hypothetical protein
MARPLGIVWVNLNPSDVMELSVDLEGARLRKFVLDSK